MFGWKRTAVAGVAVLVLGSTGTSVVAAMRAGDDRASYRAELEATAGDLRVAREQLAALQDERDELATQIAGFKGSLKRRTVAGDCTWRDCMMGQSWLEGPVGLATLEGYYVKRTVNWFGDEQTCDALIVTEGPATLLDWFDEQLDAGNLVNDRHGSGRIMVNLDLEDVPAAAVKRLKNSEEGRTVDVVTYMPPLLGQDGPACLSYLEVLAVD